MSSAPRVLIVEDDQAAYQVIRSQVLRCCPSADVVHVGSFSGHETTLLETQFDIAVLDIGLPGNIDGFAIFEAIRAQGLFEKPKTIVYTAEAVYDNDAELVERFRQGFFDYIAKPNSPLLEKALQRAYAEFVKEESFRQVTHFCDISVRKIMVRDPAHWARLRNGDPG